MRRVHWEDILALPMTTDQRTIYCGKPHRVLDGAPIGHACRLLDPAYLKAEHEEDRWRAASILLDMPLVLHNGVPAETGVDAAAQERAAAVLLDGDLGDPRGRAELRSTAPGASPDRPGRRSVVTSPCLSQ
jgi:hypothetical protein